MKTSQTSDDTDINLQAKTESQNCRLRIDLKKHNWLLRKIKREKLWIKKRSKSSERSSVKKAPKQRQTLPVSLPIALFHNFLEKLDTMNYQPSLRGVKIVQKPPMSVHAKPLNGTAIPKDLPTFQAPRIEENRVEPAISPVLQTIPITQQNSQSNNLTSKVQASMQIDSLRQIRHDNKNLTKDIIMAMKSRSNAVSIIQSKVIVEPQKCDKICQTDYEIFLSNEDTELMYILKNNNIDKNILIDLIQTASNENNNQPNLSNNNVENISLDGDDTNQLPDQLDTEHELLDTVRVHSDINKMFINLMYMINDIKEKAATLTVKGRQDVYHSLIKIFYNFFNEETANAQIINADKATQTTNANNANPENPNKRRYLSIMPNVVNAQSNKSTNNAISLKRSRPSLLPQQPEQLRAARQGQNWLEQYGSMNRQINNKFYKQKCNQNSSANYYSPITQTQYAPQQNELNQPQSQGYYGRNDARMYRAEASPGYSRQTGWYNDQEHSTPYGQQYGYQYQHPYNMPYPQRWGHQQN